MNREEIIQKIEKQRGFCDTIDAFRIVGVYTDLYGVEYHDNLSVEEELIYMYSMIKSFDDVNDFKPTDEKVCGKCKLSKQRTEFSKNSLSRDKKDKYCKACNKINTDKHKRRTPEEIERKKREKELVKELFEQGYKRCTYCKDIKSVNLFYSNPNTIEGLGTRCKTCISIITKERKEKRKKN